MHGHDRHQSRTAGPGFPESSAFGVYSIQLVEQVFGWLKTVAGLRQVKHRGGAKVDLQVTFAAAAYNLVRLRTLHVGLA